MSVATPAVSGDRQECADVPLSLVSVCASLSLSLWCTGRRALRNADTMLLGIFSWSQTSSGLSGELAEAAGWWGGGRARQVSDLFSNWVETWRQGTKPVCFKTYYWPHTAFSEYAIILLCPNSFIELLQCPKIPEQYLLSALNLINGRAKTSWHSAFYIFTDINVTFPHYGNGNTYSRCIIWIMSHPWDMELHLQFLRLVRGWCCWTWTSPPKKSPQQKIDNAYCITLRQDRFNWVKQRHVGRKSLFTLRLIGKEVLYNLRK